jgi:hypothetical protein
VALAPGTRIGAYKIGDQIGAGGMGEVYRATDTNLGRDVAIKVLPEEFAQDGERLARFEREAKTLASLNHPNIAIIHGLEKTGHVRALVMELVEGPTLAERIEHGAISIDEALPIARQIAEALEAAHEQGIIHRDLKPANVKVRPDGMVKVLDFGLAKALEPVGAMSPGHSPLPTITSPAMTRAGVILGTAAYMSPEQAKGRAADKRSDIWAFGCTFYEMLTGRRPFDGEDVSDTLASVLRGEPAWEALPPDLPPAVVQLIKRSLEKDRRRRIADVAAALFVLTGPLSGSLTTGAAPAKTVTRYPVAAMAAVAVGMAGVVAGAWWIGARSRPVESKPVTRFQIPLRSDEQFVNNGRSFIALSPDGKYLGYAANRRVNVRPLDSLEITTVRGTEGGGANFDATPRDPFFSPDGLWIGFWQGGQIKKVGINGGVQLPIAPAKPFRYVWDNDGTILFAEEGRILRVPEAGGQPEIIVDGLKERVQSLQLLPGKRSLLLTLVPERTDAEGTIVVRSLDTGRQQTLVRGIEGRYVPTGHLVYFAGGTLLAIRFDLSALAVRGSPVPVAEDVAVSSFPGWANSVAHFDISPSGTLAYLAGGFNEAFRPRTLVWVDRVGKEEPLGVADRPYVAPRLSPDGTRVAVTVNDPERDIWIWDIGRKVWRRFTIDPAIERYSIWTPDGTRIAFASNRNNEAATWWQQVDGTGTAERLAGFPFSRFGNFLPNTISPDGSTLIASAAGGPSAAGDLWMVTLAGDPKPRPLTQTTYMERNAEFSPDGRWIAYQSGETGQSEVFVQPFPELAGGKHQVSAGGGSQPAWARSGKELFFLDPSGALMNVRVDGQSSLAFGTPVKILDSSYVWTLPTYGGRHYDVSPDGRRFLMVKQSDRHQTNAPPSITVVQNWFEELKRVLPKN